MAPDPVQGSSNNGTATHRNGAGGSPVDVCPMFHEAVELIGRRWAGVILFALAEHPHYFRDLAATVPRMSDRLLSQRLRELEAEGLVDRAVHEGTPARVSYALTETGRGLEPAIRELCVWAQEWRSRPDC